MAMLTQEAAFPEVLTSTMEQRYGLYVSHAGEDGDMFVLGHHDDPRRVLAAFAAEERITGGERLGEQFEPGEARELVVFPKWGVLLDPEPDCAWGIRWTATQSDPGAFPITMLLR